MRMRNPFKFSRPQGPGFGINKSYYISVLAGVATLPPIAKVVSPKGSGGALEGFGVPLVEGTEKELLESPMSRGQYALATLDRKTVLRLRVMNADEAGFSPEAIARSGLANRLQPELLARLRSMWHLCQFTFESHDPEVYSSLDFVLACAQRLGNMTEGVIADPISEQYLLPSEVFQLPRVDAKVDAREHVTVHFRQDSTQPESGMWHAYTRGLFKFVQPEFELLGVDSADQKRVAQFLLGAAQGVLMGHLVSNGSQIGPFEARLGGLNRGLWEGIPVMELLPPTKSKVAELIF